ncbi:hypothetical protein SLEP1_g30418 [Rubroshorea leprosula]|uniref:DUF4219 domain-containing protein n=1 Tax=Rubroshorea leprosula TaxID=152421 RepID=A0AAV5K8E8_9ROSI|nr:hypothetical protein SLEP1_g30418 [Rubroshorea leprosula]
MEIATLPPNTIVPEVLEEYNYERWSILIKHYLVAQDVWDVVDPSPTNEEINERVWNKKNALSLHAIKISCGAKAFNLIKNIESARDAWQELQKRQNVPGGHYFPRRHEFVPREMATPSERGFIPSLSVFFLAKIHLCVRVRYYFSICYYRETAEQFTFLRSWLRSS